MSNVLLVIIAILLPPLAVGLKDGIAFHLLLNIILTLLGYVPGLLHALWIVLKDEGGGRQKSDQPEEHQRVER